jgi:hypothetical protein
MKNDGREGYGRIQWLGGLITVSSEQFVVRQDVACDVAVNAAQELQGITVNLSTATANTHSPLPLSPFPLHTQIQKKNCVAWSRSPATVI